MTDKRWVTIECGTEERADTIADTIEALLGVEANVTGPFDGDAGEWLFDGEAGVVEWLVEFEA